jgi:HEAT repeat protein
MSVSEVEALVKQFADSKYSSRDAAGEKLAALRAPEAVEPLLACLQPLHTPEDFSRAGDTAKILGAIGDRRAVPALLATLEKARDGRHLGFETQMTSSKGTALMYVIAALGQIGDNAAIESIKPLVGDRALYIRQTAEKALASLGAGGVVAPETRTTIARLIGELDGRGAGDAALQLAQMNASEATERIISLLESRDIDAVTKAARALGHLKDRRAVVRLIHLLKHQSSDVYCTAASALGEIGDPTAIPALIAQLRHADWGGRNTAAKAMGKIGDAAARSALQLATNDPDATVRASATSALALLRPS